MSILNADYVDKANRISKLIRIELKLILLTVRTVTVLASKHNFNFVKNSRNMMSYRSLLRKTNLLTERNITVFVF